MRIYCKQTCTFTVTTDYDMNLRHAVTIYTLYKLDPVNYNINLGKVKLTLCFKEICILHKMFRHKF